MPHITKEAEQALRDVSLRKSARIAEALRHLDGIMACHVSADVYNKICAARITLRDDIQQ